MLIKKVLKVVSATTLWAGVFLGSSSALAIDFNPAATAPNMPATYSKETFATNINAGTAMPAMYAVTEPTGATAVNNFTFTANLGNRAALRIRLGALWVRYDLGDHLGLTGTLPTEVTLATPSATGALFNASSATMDGFLLYEVPITATATSASELSLALTSNLTSTGMGDGELSISLYRNGEDAIDQNDPIMSLSTVAFKVANTLSVTPLKRTQTATVASGFTQFALGSRVPLGGFEIKITPGHLDPADGAAPDTPAIAGATATAAEMLRFYNVDTDPADGTASGTVYTSTAGFGFAAADKWSLEQLGADGQCNGDAAAAAGDPTASPAVPADPSRAVHPVGFGAMNANYPGGPATGGVTLEPWYLCATVAADNAETIAQGTVSVMMNLAPAVATNPFPPMGLPETEVGTIRHDGTTVNIPFLTSYEGYTQRLVIVNRSKVDAAYTLKFQTEGDGTADPAEVTGMAMGGTATTLKVADIVTLANPTRASGTLTLVAHPSMIDVATTMVNKMDQSTDTVVLHQGM